jgi:hypothetical protein
MDPDPAAEFDAPPERRHGAAVWIVGAVVLLLVGSVIGVVGVHLAHDAATPTTTTTKAQREQQVQYSAEQLALTRAIAQVGVKLPQVPGAAAPALPAGGPAKPLAPHQVVGFVPYWYLGPGVDADVASLTTVAYWALGINANGSLQESGPAWADLGSSDLTSLVSSGHAAGDRVLLSIATDDETVLDAISASPGPAARKLVPTLVHLVEAHGFDGVDIDLEGRNGADRAGFATFVRLVAAGVHAADPRFEVVIDTYPQSASDPDDFFDIPAIAPAVDQFFVMAYDMYQPGVPSANAPLTGTSISDATALETYAAVVPRSKIVLGVPFYGGDWTFKDSAGVPLSATGPTALTYSTIAAGHHPARWDPATYTVWFSYRYQGHTHQTWFDDPLTLALKAALAQQYHVAGVGVWALGMEGADSGLLQALLGGSRPVKLPLVSSGR